MTERMKLELRPSLLNKMCSIQMSAFFSFYVLRILIEGYVYSTSCHSFSMLMIICWLGTNVEGYNFANSSFFLLLFIYFLKILAESGLMDCYTKSYIPLGKMASSWWPGCPEGNWNHCAFNPFLNGVTPGAGFAPESGCFWVRKHIQKGLKETEGCWAISW